MLEIKTLKKNLGALCLRLFLFLILCQPMSRAVAQNTLVKGGINMSTVAGLPEKSSLIGYHLGIGGIKEVSDKLGLKYELIFSQQGAKITEDFRLVYHYLNMPILLNVRSGENFSFDVGPQVGLALTAFEKGERDRDITANLNTLDISACVGVNYFISERFFVEGRFNVGLTNVSRISETNTFRNTVFQGSVGYYFKRKNQQAE